MRLDNFLPVEKTWKAEKHLYHKIFNEILQCTEPMNNPCRLSPT